MQPLTRDRIQALIPHAGAMCLLDAVLEWDLAGIRCRAESHRGHDHPLRREGRLAAVHLIEYAAQAAAAHTALLTREQGAAPTGGVIAGLRDVVLAETRIDTVAAPLEIEACRSLGGPQGMIYRFTVRSAGALLASGRLTIMT